MKNFGQLWALVLATESSERETNSLLDYVVNRAARTAQRDRVWAVLTQQHRRQLKGPLWFLPASNLIALPEPASTTFGIVVGLLRILQRDPAARILVLPANHDVRDEEPLMRSLRAAAAQTIVRPDDLFVLGVESDSHDPDFPGIAAGSASALLRLIELRVPEIVAQVRAVVGGTNPEAEGELNAHLLGLDFHRDVLAGYERSNAHLHSAEDSRADVRIREAARCLSR